VPRTKDITKEYQEAYDSAWSSFGEWQADATKDIEAYLGQSYTAEELRVLKLQGRDALNMQDIRRVIKWVSGYQRDHRLAIKYDPVEGSDVQTASQLTRLCQRAMMRFGGYETVSNGFESAIKTGLCLVNAYNDNKFDTKLDTFFYNQFLIDPNFTRIDLRDCNFGILRRYVTKDWAKQLVPRSQHKFINDVKDEPYASQDGKFPNYKPPYLYGNKMIAFDEFQQRDTVEKIFVGIKPTGQEFEFEGTKQDLERDLPEILQANGVPAELVTVETRTVMTVRVSSFINREQMDTSMDPYGIRDFSFTPIWGFYDPEYWRMSLKLQGLVRCLVDPQRANNKRMSSMIAHFENMIGSGLDYEQGALVDDEDAWKTGPGQPRVFKKNRLATGARDRSVPDMPAGMVQLHKIFSDSIPRMVNINDEMFGQAKTGDNLQISGVVGKLRVGAGLVGLRGLFDDLSFSQKEIGRKVQMLLQQVPTEKVLRILQERPTQEFYNKTFSEYDSAVAEGVLTDTQRALDYTEKVNLKRMGMELGDPAPIGWSDLLESLPSPSSHELVQKAKQAEQQKAQQAQQQQQMQDTMTQLSIQGAQSEMRLNEAQAAQNITQSQENSTGAALDRVKTAAQIQDLEGGSIERVVDQLIRLEELKLKQQESRQGAKNESR